MKYLALYVIILIAVTNCHKKIEKMETNISSPNNFSQTDAKMFVSFAKNVSCAAKPLEQSCPKCINSANGYKLFFFYQTTRFQTNRFKFMIHYNDSTKKVVVSFAGPNARTSARYIQRIYSMGFSWVRTFRVQLESEYNIVYYHQLRSILRKKIEKIKHSGRAGYQFVFVGHSVGGSLATLASYDLTNSKLISKSHNHTEVFTYGALRIGDAHFVSLVNAAVVLYRVINPTDYIVRIPNCYYSVPGLNWRCYTQALINRYIGVPTSPLFVYLQNYRYSTFYRVPVVYSVRSYSTVFYRHNSQSAARQQGPQLTRSHSLHRHLPERKIHHEQPKHRFQPIKHMEARKSMPMHQMRRPSHRIVKDPKYHMQKIQDLFKKHPHHQMQQQRHIQQPRQPVQFNKPTFAQQKLLHNSSKLQDERKMQDLLRQSHQQPNRQVKPNLTQARPLPKPLAKPQVQNLPKLQFKTPVIAKNFYYANVYYTQPFGLLYYTSNLTTVCTYQNFYNVCERRFVLPATFTLGPHFSYLGVSLDECAA